MLSLTNPAEVARALHDTDLDADLRALITHRAWQLCAEGDGPLGGDARFIVVEGGDTAEVINDAVGFPITGEDAEVPRYVWLEDHGLWFEIAYARGEGSRTFIFVENTPATELGIHYLCLSHFWSEGEGRDQ